MLGDVVVNVELTKFYGELRANDELTFDARTAETVAIVGQSGCGKSTFAKILMGLESASSGSIQLAALEVSDLPVGRRPRQTIRGLQMVFQNPFDTLKPEPHDWLANRTRHSQVRGGERRKESPGAGVGVTRPGLSCRTVCTAEAAAVRRAATAHWYC